MAIRDSRQGETTRNTGNSGPTQLLDAVEDGNKLIRPPSKLKRLTLTWRRPVAAPNVAAYAVRAPPRSEAKIVMTIDCLRLSPNSQPRKPVAKHEMFIVPLAQSRAIDNSSLQCTGRLSSGRLRTMASDSMPNFLSMRRSKALNLAKMPSPLRISDGEESSLELVTFRVALVSAAYSGAPCPFSASYSIVSNQHDRLSQARGLF